jgi:PAS domain S-box-containing protein
MRPELAVVLETAEKLAHLGSWELDLRSGKTVWSAQLYRIVGLEPGAGEHSRGEVLDFVHPDDRERVGSLLERVVERPDDVPEEGITVDLRLVRADGSPRDVRARGNVVSDADGRPARWVGTLQDVTDQRMSERELQAHYAVGQALREWESFEPGVMELLRLIGTALSYPMGSLWAWNSDVDALTCRAFWHAPDADPGQFELIKRALTFKPGQGKPGVAWQTQKPVITPDALSDPVFQPREAAVVAGMRSGVAFPAIGADGPVAVLSFYSFDHIVPSKSLVRTLEAIGHELGHFLGRRRADLGPRPLSDREVEVLRYAAEGNSGPQIASTLFVSPATIKTHFENIYEKLGVSDRPAAVALALRTGLIR